MFKTNLNHTPMCDKSHEKTHTDTRLARDTKALSIAYHTSVKGKTKLIFISLMCNYYISCQFSGNDVSLL